MTTPSVPANSAQNHPASIVFLDRDGTIIFDVHYLSRPEQVTLLDGAAEAIARLNQAQIPVILVTNQSGIARGYLTTADYERGQARLVELLAQQGAHLDAAYYCPHYPPISGPCECRKPGTLLFRRAIEEHHLDPSNPVFIGDRWRDVAPMQALGGHGILIRSPENTPEDLASAENTAPILPSLAAAVDRLFAAPL